MVIRPDFAVVHAYQDVPFGAGNAERPNIVRYVAWRAAVSGDKPCLTAVEGGGGGEETLTFGELDRRSRAVGAWVRHTLGAGEVVGLLPVNDLPSVVAVFGLLRAGCAVLVLNPADPPARIAEQVHAAGATHVLRPPAVPPEAYPDAVAVGAAPDELVTDFADADPEPVADALLFGTSGSTAASKLVVQSHGNLVANALAVRAHHGLGPGDTMLGCLPIHHVNGLHFTVLATVVNGSHAVLARAFDPLGYPRLVDRYLPRIASVVPPILEALLVTWRRPGSLPGFDYFVSAAAPLDASVARAVHTRLGTRVMQGYGLSETTNFSTTMPPDVSMPAYRQLMLDAEIPSVGVALPGNEVAVLDQDGQRLPPGREGELCMRGHNVMTRYAGNPEATDEAFRHGWFHSQDLGRAVVDQESGRTFFVITGRAKNIAKVMGETVSLDEMDRVLRAVPGVRDAACVRVPGVLTGDEIVAAVVADDGVDVLDPLRAAFPPAAMPARIVRLDRLPRTPTGKIRRPELTDHLSGGAGQ